MKEYKVTFKFERNNVKGKVEQSERTYQGFYETRKLALDSAKAMFKENEPTARKTKTSIELIK